MSFERLSSDEVPDRFTEWLLNMGCPAEQVPSIEKITKMCRGQYYMVWRSLMEHVHPKDTIRQKRLNVFCDDVRICKDDKTYKDVNVIVPEQLKLWRQHIELKEKLADAEARVELSRKSIKELTDRESIKLIQRNTTKCSLEDRQRRIWLLKQVADVLVKKKRNLEEAKQISKSMCPNNANKHIRKTLDECLSVVSKELTSPATSEEPVQDQFAKAETLMTQLSTCGDALWPLLLEQRAAAAAQLAATDVAADPPSRRMSPYYVLAVTSSLHAALALEVMKGRVHVEQTKKNFAAALNDIHHAMSDESCELLVLQCELAHAQARVRALRSCAGDMAAQRGVFAAETRDADPADTVHRIRDLDDAIISKKEELCRLVKGLAVMENKIYHTKDCVQTVFQAFKTGGRLEPMACRGIKLDLPEESIGSLCQFYRERRAKAESKANISMELDVSDVSYNDVTDTSDFTFVDELKMYLKKFSLEKNRKLVLDSGEKIWIFQTIQSSLSRLYSDWLDKNQPALFCPSVGIVKNVQNILEQVRERDALEQIVKKICNDDNHVMNIDMKPIQDEEAKLTDEVQKRNADNISSLQKINKTLELSQYNLQFWMDENAKKHISANRTVDGRSYKEYEAFYLENIIIKS